MQQTLSSRDENNVTDKSEAEKYAIRLEPEAMEDEGDFFDDVSDPEEK